MDGLNEVTYKVYATPNKQGQVETIFSTCFFEPKETDVLIKEGVGDEFTQVGYYEVLDSNGCHNYKIVKGKMIETTANDKQKELDSRPEPTLTQHEMLTKETHDVALVSADDNMLNMDLLVSLDDKLNLIMEHLGLC